MSGGTKSLKVLISLYIVVKLWPLNYFVYPYVEVDGVPWQGKMEKSFSYADVSQEELTATATALNLAE